MSTTEKSTLEKFGLEIKRIMEEKTEHPRKKKGVIRELFNEIEAANFLGYSLEDILKTMKDNGFDSNLKLQTFYTIMTKIRKERGTVGMKKTKTIALPSNQNTKETVTPPTPTPTPNQTLVEPEPQYTTAEERRKAESKKIAEKYSGKTDDESENGIMKFL